MRHLRAISGDRVAKGHPGMPDPVIYLLVFLVAGEQNIKATPA